MRTLDLAKCPWFKSAKIDFIREGLFRGALACNVVLNDVPGDPDSLALLLKALLHARLPPRRKIVHVSGPMSGDDPLLPIACNALFEYGFRVHLAVNGNVIPRQMSESVSWTTASVRDATPFLSSVDEIIYSPARVADGQIEDLVFPLPPARQTFLFLNAAAGFSFDEIDTFVCKSTHDWNVVGV